MIKTTRDMMGKELRKGQFIAFAERVGNVAELRTGFVDEVHDDGTVTLSWSLPKGGPVKSRVTIRGEHIDRPRIIVVG